MICLPRIKKRPEIFDPKEVGDRLKSLSGIKKRPEIFDPKEVGDRLKSLSGKKSILRYALVYLRMPCYSGSCC